MKKLAIRSLVLLAWSMNLASCTSDDVRENNSVISGSQGLVSIEISSEISGGRTHLNGLNVEFDNTDKLAVWDGTTKREFTTSAGGSVALFKGEIAENASQLNILYPFSAGQDCTTGGTITATIPIEQTATENTFDPKANLAAATATYTKGQNITCTLQNVCGVLKFTVPTGETYTKAVITGANGTEKIAGEVTIDATESTPKATGGNATEITLKGTIEGGKNYYVALIPQEYTDGIVVKLYEKDTYTYAYIDKTLTKSGGPVVIKPAVILNAGTIKAEWPDDAVDLGIRDATTGKPTLWANKNVGATEPWDYGWYLGWGATKPLLSAYTLSADKRSMTSKTWVTEKPEDKYPAWEGGDKGYTWENGPFQQTKGLDEYSNTSGVNSSWTKYFPGGKTVLDPEDDAATVNMGENWRMPTHDELLQIYNQCYWVWTDDYDEKSVAGYIIYKSYDKTKDYKKTKLSSHNYTIADTHIFFPAANIFGFPNGTDITMGSMCDLYSSTYCPNTYKAAAYSIQCTSGGIYPDNDALRARGRSVRGVVKK